MMNDVVDKAVNENVGMSAIVNNFLSPDEIQDGGKCCNGYGQTNE